MIIHADNTGPHVTKCVREYMDHNSLRKIPHPPYSADLAPSDFYLFGYVKDRLQGHEFREGAELVSDILEILNRIPTDTLVDVFDNWMRRLQRCIYISGEYVE
jgi:histone-lysine N-methyltransferase SETMAR